MPYINYPLTVVPPKYPVISPTGALSSGDYVNYMIGYDQQLATYVQFNLENCYTQDTIDRWGDLWNRILSDMTEQIADLTDRSNKIQAKITMVQNIIKTL